MAKITLDQIKQELEQEGWKVHSLEYKNLETEMTFECPSQVFLEEITTRRDAPPEVTFQ